MPGLRRFIALAALLTYVAFSPAPVAGISSGVVISQVYGGGGNAGATYKNDFIELHNRGGSAVDLTGWSVQYAAVGGTTWQRTNLTGVMLQAGQYYLIQEAAGASTTAINLPNPDATGTIPMSANAGKVALVNTQTTLSGSGCPFDTSIVDFVGFGTGTGSTCFEGPSPTATLSNTTAAIRGSNGCTETDVNSTDFATGAPTPRNIASSIFNCAAPSTPPSITSATADPSLAAQGGSVTFTVVVKPGINPADSNLSVTGDFSSIGGTGTFALTGANASTGEQTFTATVSIGSAVTPGPKSIPVTATDGLNRQATTAIVVAVRFSTLTPIHDIQGITAFSPLDGMLLTTRGMVTGRRSNGFFIQDEEANYDADANTSEGVFVFTSSAPPAAAAIGNAVFVIGTVDEFIPSADPFSPPTTEITSPFVAVDAVGGTMPAPVALTSADLNAAGPVDQLERLEGMRVSVASLAVVAPTGGTVSEANATSTTSGVFYGVLPTVTRPFREPGIEVFEATGKPLTIPRFDANPERLRVDSDAIGHAAINVLPGAIVENIVGPLDYSFRSYTVDLEPAAPTIVPPLIPVATPVRVAGANEFTVASTNIERFFDTADDPGVSDVVLTQTAFDNRLNKLSLQIRQVMRSPDIIGLEEVDNLPTLQAIAARINADTVASGAPDPAYTAYLETGNDIGGIDSGLLVKTSRVDVLDVTQWGKDTTYVTPANTSEPLNDRPPLVLHAVVHKTPGDGGTPVTVIVNHMRSLSGVNDAVDGARVRAKRRAQAEYLANLIQMFQSTNPTERIVSVGDYNAFQFNDGYVDSIGTIKGTPAPADQVLLPSDDLVNPNLVDLVDTAPADQRYSFIFDGNAQELDHVLVTQNLVPLSNGLSYGRNNADFPEVLRNDPNTPFRLSDHDPLVAYFSFPEQTTTQVSANPPTATFGQPITFTATVTTGGSPATQGTVTFTEGSVKLGGPIALDGAGTATFTTSALSAGAHTVTAAYPGAGAAQPSTADVVVVVHSAPTTTSFVSSQNPSGVGQAVTFTATVTSSVIGPGPVTVGSVTFSESGPVLGTVQVDVNGRALLTTSSLGGGSHQIVADYTDGNDYLASSATVTQQVRPTIVINDVTVTEGNTGASVTAVFTVTLLAPSTDTVTVDFDDATHPGTATVDVDYARASGTLIFSPGETVKTIGVTVNGDIVNEPDEIFSVNLTNAFNATIADPQGIATIANDDPVPAISINDVTVREPERGATTAPAVFTVRLSNPSQQTVLAHFATADGTAREASDYIATAGTLVFALGETTQTITVNVISNSRREPTETFFVNLSAATNATIGDSQGVGSIVDRRAPRLSITTFTPHAGTRGSRVQIIGRAFGDVTSVKFNGVAAAFTLISSNVIRATVPATATTGRITVSSATETATSVGVFTVGRNKVGDHDDDDDDHGHGGGGDRDRDGRDR
jgi:predicted extracellular nuclease